MYLTVYPLRGPGSISGRGGVFQGIFPLTLAGCWLAGWLLKNHLVRGNCVTEVGATLLFLTAFHLPQL